VSVAVPREPRGRAMLDLYRGTIRVAVINEFQYRVGHYLYMIGMVAEPVIYLVVWSTIAKSQGGSVDGYTPGDFAAYYIVWTLVRNMNIVFTPYGWEERIREGKLSGDLLRPVHPIHYDIAWFAGWKFVMIVLWLPIAAVLALLFHPTLSPDALDIVVFCVAIWGAYLIRTMNLWALGLVSLWTTRVSALYETYFVVELLFSGRLVPLALMPLWMQRVAGFLPFKWTFGFPIEALVGNLPTSQLLFGLGMQVFWTVVGALMVAIIWKRGVRKYSAVGN
jgi:ABC-2 type transport system permease protein